MAKMLPMRAASTTIANDSIHEILGINEELPTRAKQCRNMILSRSLLLNMAKSESVQSKPSKSENADEQPRSCNGSELSSSA
jgi:hypothetical protein